MLRSRLALSLALVLAYAAVPASAAAPPDVPAALRSVLHWRAIGPARGGRTIAATGVPGRPHEFYVAAVNGGIFKTTDAGRVWTPVFDDQPTAVKADRYGVVMRPRDRDCDRDLVARLVHVNGGRLDRGLVRHHVQA